jgi:hypothetical protein
MANRFSCRPIINQFEMKKLSAYLMASVAMSLILFSCSKDDDSNGGGSTSKGNESPIPNIPGAAGVLVAFNNSVVQNVPFIGEQTTVMGLATAVFFDDSGNQINAGSVAINGNDLAYMSGAYVFTPGITNPMGLEFTGSVGWEVSGGNGIPNFVHTNPGGVPVVGGLTGVTDEISGGFTVHINVNNPATNLQGVDSVMFNLYGPDGEVLITRPGNARSYSFSAAEVAKVGKGQGIVQVAAYRLAIESKSGKDFAFVNQGVFNKFVSYK